MDNDRTFSSTRILPFSPDTIYGAFASADLLASWWGPDGFTNSFEVFEFTVGGRWKFVMHGPDGTDYPNECVFAELEPAGRVVIRHDCAPHFTLEVRLAPVDGGTLLTWDQVFDDSRTALAVRPIGVPANEQNLDRLSAELARVG